MKKKDLKYQPIGQLVDGVGDSPTFERYQDERYQDDPLSESAVAPSNSNGTPKSSHDHPLQNENDHGNNNLRLRRQPLSRESSQDNIVVLEGLGSHIEVNNNSRGSSTPRRNNRHHDMKSSNTEVSAGGDEEEDSHSGSGIGNGSIGVSRSSSFDLLDDEDEINLQRYHRDFGASPYVNTMNEEFGWNNDNGMDNSAGVYHPRTESNGSNSKDPWIRMTQNQQSPTHAGNVSLASVHSLSDFLLYLQGVRRQARQRRAQRLLTMPSEQWWERLQFLVMTYCWDATDVGLLVIGILLVIWFGGLLWLARINARAENTTGENHNGAEYDGNAQFDEYEEEGRSFRIMFQWCWWGLGILLLVRILGPLTVHNVNNRRRERRRQRFMSGNMQDQQRRMQQQQLPTIMHSGHGSSNPHEGSESESYNEDSLSGVEITGTGSGDCTDSVGPATMNVPGDPMTLA